MAACHSIDRAITAIASTQANLGAPPTWAPVIYFDEGRAELLAGGYSHDVAMEVAEKTHEYLGASGFGVRREGLRRAPPRLRSEQELIWGVTMDPNDRIIRLPQVIDRVGLKKTAIYKRIAAGTFPKQIKLGFASGWLESEITAWIEEQARQRS